MTDDRTKTGNDEPALTEKNSGTIRGEEALANDAGLDDSAIEKRDNAAGARA